MIEIVDRTLKSNDLGDFLEDEMKNALLRRRCLFWRLHTIRSWRGVSNPCDYIVLDEKYSALLECKATLSESFSCANFRQVKHFVNSAKFSHVGHYGVVVCFYSAAPVYVYAGDKKVIENKQKRRPIRASVGESFDIISDSLDELLKELEVL